MPKWLNDAVFYEIYPQSFYDTNGDGIGDIPGIIEKLDYIKDLGCNALWINPCYDSPFKDAGYDVRDYKKVASRYGTNEDLYELFRVAHQKGIHVLIDLVPGHTSEEHEWFRESCKPEKNEYSDRYIWTDFWIKGTPGHPYIGGECDRNGTYMLNFFKCQPALNYGFFNPTESWQTSYKDPAAVATQDAMIDVMRFWLDRGCDGFRVDMADSLVKDDDKDKTGTCSIWQRIRKMLDTDYPEAALVAEWSNPWQAIASAGFHMDFYLDHGGNGYNTLLRDYETPGGDNSFFKKNANGDIGRFLKDFLPRYEISRGKGYVSFITCNHDTPRATNTLDESELKLAYATLLTLPGVPFIYYGDEIGMKYIADMPTKEGGYTRTGTRTPMQWSEGPNKGFSDASPDMLYLPVDANGPSVESESARPDSLYNTVKTLLKLKNANEDLKADADFKVILGIPGHPFVYQRGSMTIAVNSETRPATLDITGLIRGKSDQISQAGSPDKIVFSVGDPSFNAGKLELPAQSFAILL